MPYSYPDDVRKVWNKVLTTELTADEIASAIDRSDNIINAALALRYTVPFASQPPQTPPIIRDLSATFALFEIVDRAPTTPEWVQRKIERAEKILELLANGTMSVVGPGGGLVPVLQDLGAIQSSTADFVPTFGANPSTSERVDPDRAEQEAAERVP